MSNEKKVPSYSVTIAKGTEDERSFKMYQWLTQEEHDQYQSILLADRDMEVSGDGKQKMSIPATTMAQGRKFLVETLCIDLSWDEFNYMRPDLRDEVLDKIDAAMDIQRKKKKLPSKSS